MKQMTLMKIIQAVKKFKRLVQKLQVKNFYQQKFQMIRNKIRNYNPQISQPYRKRILSPILNKIS
jgi:hypothetical protein